MTIISIDFSINSPAVIIKDDTSLQIFSFVPNFNDKLKSSDIYNRLSKIIHVISYKKEMTTNDPVKDQTIKMKNADYLSDAIMSAIIPHIKEIPQIRIEGFSFGSKGNSFIDMISFNTFLKVKMIQKWGHVIKVISPKTIKKMFTGNGNASKCDMLRYFVNNYDNSLVDIINKLGIVQDGEFKIRKPFDDLIDAYALIQIEI